MDNSKIEDLKLQDWYRIWRRVVEIRDISDPFSRYYLRPEMECQNRRAQWEMISDYDYFIQKVIPRVTTMVSETDKITPYWLVECCNDILEEEISTEGEVENENRKVGRSDNRKVGRSENTIDYISVGCNVL